MDAHWWGTVLGIIGVLLSGGFAWGRFNERLKQLDKTLTNCSDHDYMTSDACAKCKAEMVARMDAVCADLKADAIGLHAYQLRTSEIIGRIDGIISRHALGGVHE
jgi:hypothetical protein